MNAKIVKKCSVTAIILVALYFLVILINPEVTRYLQKPFSRMMISVLTTHLQEPFFTVSYPVHTIDGFFPHHTVLSLALLIPAFMLLRYAKKEKSTQLIRTSKMTLLAGWCYFAISWLTWISCILDEIGNVLRQKSFYFAEKTPIGVIDGVMHYETQLDEAYLQYLRIEQITVWIDRIYSILACVIAVFLFIVFFISLKNAAVKRMRFKGELVKPVVALTILVPELIYWVRYIVVKLCYDKMPAEQLNNLYMIIERIHSLAFTLLPLAAIVFMLLMHCIIKIKPDDWDDVPPDEIVYVQAENIME